MMKVQTHRRRLNVKALYFGAIKEFNKRNRQVLPQLLLQYGRCERWLSREFALAMNAHLAGRFGETHLPAFADCEWRFEDISVWSPPMESPLAVYEVKALYKRDQIEGVVQKARTQLSSCRVATTKNRFGVFFAIYVAKGGWQSKKVTQFKKRVREAVRAEFSSDHNIRLTNLVPLTNVYFGSELWRVACWLTWGRLK